MTNLDSNFRKGKPNFDQQDFASRVDHELSKLINNIKPKLDQKAKPGQREFLYDCCGEMFAVLGAGYNKMMADGLAESEVKKLATQLHQRIARLMVAHKKREPKAIADFKRDQKVARIQALQIEKEEAQAEAVKRRLAIEMFPDLAKQDFIIIGNTLLSATEMTPEEQAEDERYWIARTESQHATLEEFEADFKVISKLKGASATINGATDDKPKKGRDYDFEPPNEIIEVLDSDWADPVDLWGNFDPPELTHGLLPKVIEDYALITGETMGADPGGIAMAALAVCAGAITDDVKLKMKRHSDDWFECARIWVALVGDPSSKKSPIRSVTTKPINKLDAELLRIFVEEMAEWNALPKEEQLTTPKPKRLRYVMDDFTLEALQEVLKDNFQGILVNVDEMSGWIGSMDKYGGGKGGAAKDRGAHLSAFNGGMMPVDRVTRGSFVIPNWGYSLLGGIQPSVISQMAAGSYDDGFLQRMLIVMLPSATLGRDEPAPPITATYNKLIRSLSELRPPPPGKWNMSGEVETLSFDPKAQALRNEMEAKHLGLMKIQSLNKKLAGHLGKYDGYFGKLCVLFHCIEHADEKALPSTVTLGTAQRVAGFMDKFLLPHALAFYAGLLGLSDNHDTLTSIAGYVLAHHKLKITHRDAQRGSRVMRNLKQRETTELYEQLEAVGWFGRVVDKRGRVEYWSVNPKVHRLFADRANRERETRNATRELILQSVSARRKTDQ